MNKFNGVIMLFVGAGLCAVSVIGLWNGVMVGRFSHPGGFDALTCLQFAFGVAGLALSAIGLRQQRSISQSIQ